MEKNNLKRVKDLALRLARFYGLIRAGRRSVEKNRELDLETANLYLKLAGKKTPKRVSTPGDGYEWYCRGADYYRKLPIGIGTQRAADRAITELGELGVSMTNVLRGEIQDGGIPAEAL